MKTFDADGRHVLVHAIIVAGDRAGADVGLLADHGVAEIAQVAGLGARADLRLLDLDEIAEVHVAPELGAATDAGERPDRRARADGHVLDVAEGADLDIVGDLHARPEHHVREDRHVAADLGVVGEIDAGRVLQRHAGLHEVVAPQLLELRFGPSELRRGR